MLVAFVSSQATNARHRALPFRKIHSARRFLTPLARTATSESHAQIKKGYIQIAGADGILVARIFPGEPRDLFYLSEKFIGRLVGWFENELVAINVQFLPEEEEEEEMEEEE